MRWTADDLRKYQDGMEYFDTALIPCYSIELGEMRAERLKEIEDWMDRVMLLEEKLKGRVILFPPLVYFGDYKGVLEQEIRLIKQALAQFKHLFFVACQMDVEEEINRVLEMERGAFLLRRNEMEDWTTKVIQAWNR